MNRVWTSWGDRRHWELNLGRVRLLRWCPGAPCHLDGVRDQPHRVQVHWFHRSGSAARR